MQLTKILTPKQVSILLKALMGDSIERSELRELYYAHPKLAEFLEELYKQELIEIDVTSWELGDFLSLREWLNYRYGGRAKFPGLNALLKSNVVSLGDGVFKIKDMELPILNLDMILAMKDEELSSKLQKLYPRAVIADSSVSCSIEIGIEEEDRLCCTSDDMEIYVKELKEGDIIKEIQYYADSPRGISVKYIVPLDKLPEARKDVTEKLRHMIKLVQLYHDVNMEKRKNSIDYGDLSIRYPMNILTKNFKISYRESREYFLLSSVKERGRERGKTTEGYDITDFFPDYVRVSVWTRFGVVDEPKRLQKYFNGGHIEIRVTTSSLSIDILDPNPRSLEHYTPERIFKLLSSNIVLRLMAEVISENAETCGLVKFLETTKPTTLEDLRFHTMLYTMSSRNSIHAKEQHAIAILFYVFKNKLFNIFAKPMDLVKFNMIRVQDYIRLKGGEIYYKNTPVESLIEHLKPNPGVKKKLINVLSVYLLDSIVTGKRTRVKQGVEENKLLL